MKTLERIGAIVTLIVLWIFIAFAAGILVRPIYEAFRFGFDAWGA